MTPKIVFAGLALLALTASSACTKSGGSSAPVISPAAKQEAAEIFSSRCTVCHGAQGAGDASQSGSCREDRGCERPGCARARPG